MEDPIVEINPTKKLKVHPINEVIANPNVPKFYGNGFQCGATLADGSLMVKHNDEPVCLISMSLPALKSLHEQIGQILNLYKKNFDIEILSFEDLTKKVIKTTEK